MDVDGARRAIGPGCRPGLRRSSAARTAVRCRQNFGQIKSELQSNAVRFCRPLHDLSLGAAFRAGDGETSALAVAPAAVAELARRRDLHQGPRQVGVSVPGGGQAREHDRFLSLGDPQHQGSEAIPRQGAERIEGVGAARGAQHRQGAGLCRCHRGAEGRGQVPEGHEAQAGEIPQQRRRGRPRQAQAADPARARVQDDEDGLRPRSRASR